jgi:hypothetical protein
VGAFLNAVMKLRVTQNVRISSLAKDVFPERTLLHGVIIIIVIITYALSSYRPNVAPSYRLIISPTTLSSSAVVSLRWCGFRII